jgi:hypothetical protein
MTAILGGLIGSILTVVITKILDIFQKRKDFIYGLKRTFFERKLAIAEAAISRWHIFSAYLNSIYGLFELFSKDIILFLNPPPQFFQSYSDMLTQQITKLSSPALDAANAAALFFDIEEIQGKSFIKELSALILSLDSRQKFLFQLAQFMNSQPPTEKEKTSAVISKVLSEMREDIKKVSDQIEGQSANILLAKQKIREEMKKFEL